MTLVDDIKGRIDLLAYIGQYVPLKQAGRLHKGLCPFHSEKTPSFTVDTTRGTWRCWGACGVGGDVIAFAQRKHGWTFTEALEELGRSVGIEVHRPETRAHHQRLDELRGVLSAAADFFAAALQRPQGLPALRYLRDKRGLTNATLEFFQIGYALPGWHSLLDHLHSLGYEPPLLLEAGLASRNEQGRVFDYFRNRIIIPIRDERGRVVGFGGRALRDSDQPKYLNSPQSPLFDKSRLLFAYDLARQASSVVVVEGYMDAIQAHQAGFSNVVAQMGTALTEHQLKQLPSQIVLALDGDNAGKEATKRTLPLLVRAEKDIRVITLAENTDPDDLLRQSPSDWTTLVETAEPLPDYIIRVGCESLPENASAAQRFKRAIELIPLLIECESDVLKQTNVQALALYLKLPASQLVNSSPRKAASVPVPQPPQAVARHIELSLIRTLLAHPEFGLTANRELRELGLDPLTPSDFISYGGLFALYEESAVQFDEESNAWFQARIDPLAQAALEANEVMIQTDFLNFALRQRMSRVEAEQEYLLAAQDYDGVRRCASQIFQLRERRAVYA